MCLSSPNPNPVLAKLTCQALPARKATLACKSLTANRAVLFIGLARIPKQSAEHPAGGSVDTCSRGEAEGVAAQVSKKRTKISSPAPSEEIPFFIWMRTWSAEIFRIVGRSALLAPTLTSSVTLRLWLTLREGASQHPSLH